MGCGTSKNNAEEKVRLRKASQIQVDAVQRAEAAYRRQRMALEKEATSYRRASIEIQRARIMKEMYCSGYDTNGAQESLACNFGSHKEIANDKVCPDLTITEVEDKNNEDRSPIKPDREGIVGNKIEQTPQGEIENTKSEQKRILTDDTKTVLEDQPDHDRNALEPGSENQGLTYALENPDQQTVTDNTNENIELESLFEEQNEQITTANIPSDESGTLVANTEEGETNMGNENTRSLSHAETSNEQLASDATLGTDNMQNEAKEGEIINNLKA